jgi:hypothetical protein
MATPDTITVTQLARLGRHARSTGNRDCALLGWTSNARSVDKRVAGHRTAVAERTAGYPERIADDDRACGERYWANAALSTRTDTSSAGCKSSLLP